MLYRGICRECHERRRPDRYYSQIAHKSTASDIVTVSRLLTAVTTGGRI